MTGTKLASKSAVREGKHDQAHHPSATDPRRPRLPRGRDRADGCVRRTGCRPGAASRRGRHRPRLAGRPRSGPGPRRRACATPPVVFATSQSQRAIARGENGMAEWWRFVAALPQGTVGQAEAAADAAALALWWAGCFPEWVERGSSGNGMVRAYVTFAGRMLALAADLLESSAPEEAALCARAADARTELHAALAEARVDYIGEDPHSSESRLNRFLRRLEEN